MYRDGIIDEVWRLRDAYVEQHHHDLAEIVADLQARQRRSASRLVDRRGRARRSSRAHKLGG
jgi:hypothetical protein